ncbi:hypothetical protein EBR77_02860 [bacterium]|nr:hypothetical protein [bacterium]NBX78067.1 hypothetical protein [bacterium]
MKKLLFLSLVLAAPLSHSMQVRRAFAAITSMNARSLSTEFSSIILGQKLAELRIDELNKTKIIRELKTRLSYLLSEQRSLITVIRENNTSEIGKRHLESYKYPLKLKNSYTTEKEIVELIEKSNTELAELEKQIQKTEEYFKVACEREALLKEKRA